ncbi:MAG: zinc ribbon domain-containing protein [Actinomycetota bacterium]
MSPAARGAQRFCPNCGAKVTKTQKFCPSCGEALQPAADATAELPPPAPPTAPKAGTRKSAAATQPLPPPARGTAPPPPPPPPPPPAGGDIDRAAWIGAGACGALVIATGLPWFGGAFSVDSYDIPFALLFSNTAAGGLPIGIVFVLAAAAGLGVALLKPDPRMLTITFLSAGGSASFLMLWYVIRIMSQLQGASLFEAVSIGAWLALVASAAMLTAGVLLRQSAARAGLSSPRG